jgi:hypothetical protein
MNKAQNSSTAILCFIILYSIWNGLCPLPFVRIAEDRQWHFVIVHIVSPQLRLVKDGIPSLLPPCMSLLLLFVLISQENDQLGRVTVNVDP